MQGRPCDRAPGSALPGFLSLLNAISSARDFPKPASQREEWGRRRKRSMLFDGSVQQSWKQSAW